MVLQRKIIEIEEHLMELKGKYNLDLQNIKELTKLVLGREQEEGLQRGYLNRERDLEKG